MKTSLHNESEATTANAVLPETSNSQISTSDRGYKARCQREFSKDKAFVWVDVVEMPGVAWKLTRNKLPKSIKALSKDEEIEVYPILDVDPPKECSMIPPQDLIKRRVQYDMAQQQRHLCEHHIDMPQLQFDQMFNDLTNDLGDKDALDKLRKSAWQSSRLPITSKDASQQLYQIVTLVEACKISFTRCKFDSSKVFNMICKFAKTEMQNLVGSNSEMVASTPSDVLAGYMKIAVDLIIDHPEEFSILKCPCPKVDAVDVLLAHISNQATQDWLKDNLRCCALCRTICKDRKLKEEPYIHKSHWIPDAAFRVLTLIHPHPDNTLQQDLLKFYCRSSNVENDLDISYEKMHLRNIAHYQLCGTCEDSMSLICEDDFKLTLSNVIAKKNVNHVNSKLYTFAAKIAWQALNSSFVLLPYYWAYVRPMASLLLGLVPVSTQLVPARVYAFCQNITKNQEVYGLREFRITSNTLPALGLWVGPLVLVIFFQNDDAMGWKVTFLEMILKNNSSVLLKVLKEPDEIFTLHLNELPTGINAIAKGTELVVYPTKSPEIWSLTPTLDQLLPKNGRVFFSAEENVTDDLSSHEVELLPDSLLQNLGLEIVNAEMDVIDHIMREQGKSEWTICDTEMWDEKNDEPCGDIIGSIGCILRPLLKDIKYIPSISVFYIRSATNLENSPCMVVGLQETNFSLYSKLDCQLPENGLAALDWIRNVRPEAFVSGGGGYTLPQVKATMNTINIKLCNYNNELAYMVAVLLTTESSETRKVTTEKLALQEKGMALRLETLTTLPLDIVKEAIKCFYDGLHPALLAVSAHYAGLLSKLAFVYLPSRSIDGLINATKIYSVALLIWYRRWNYDMFIDYGNEIDTCLSLLSNWWKLDDTRVWCKILTCEQRCDLLKCFTQLVHLRIGFISDSKKHSHQHMEVCTRIYSWVLYRICLRCAVECKLQCSKCNAAFFCSRKCSIKIWRTMHKPVCEQLAKEDLSDYVYDIIP